MLGLATGLQCYTAEARHMLLANGWQIAKVDINQGANRLEQGAQIQTLQQVSATQRQKAPIACGHINSVEWQGTISKCCARASDCLRSNQACKLAVSTCHVWETKQNVKADTGMHQKARKGTASPMCLETGIHCITPLI